MWIIVNMELGGDCHANSEIEDLCSENGEYTVADQDDGEILFRRRWRRKSTSSEGSSRSGVLSSLENPSRPCGLTRAERDRVAASSTPGKQPENCSRQVNGELAHVLNSPQLTESIPTRTRESAVSATDHGRVRRQLPDTPAVSRSIPETFRVMPATRQPAPATSERSSVTPRAIPATFQTLPAMAQTEPATFRESLTTLQPIPATFCSSPATELPEVVTSQTVRVTQPNCSGARMETSNPARPEIDDGLHVSTANRRTISPNRQSTDAGFRDSCRSVYNETSHRRCQVKSFHPNDRARAKCYDGYSTDCSDTGFDQVCEEQLVTGKYGVCSQAKHRCCCRSSVKKLYQESEFRHRNNADCHMHRIEDPRYLVSCDDSDNAEFRNEPCVRETSTTGIQKNKERNRTQKPLKNCHNINRPSADNIPSGFGRLPATESAQHQPSHMRYLPHVTLGSYRGDSCLETFLSKFENISSYLSWNESDRLFHLRASLEGAAGRSCGMPEFRHRHLM